MNLRSALRIQPGESIAFSGSGGKTTTLFTLARQLDDPVVATTTTHFSKQQLAFADHVISTTDFGNIPQFVKLIKPKQFGPKILILYFFPICRILFSK